MHREGIGQDGHQGLLQLLQPLIHSIHDSPIVFEEDHAVCADPQLSFAFYFSSCFLPSVVAFYPYYQVFIIHQKCDCL